ncbi:MAG TPA: hypothetical protein VGI95_07375 [Caulobacteraceae bacterium]|jgi:hypothetical protein
MSMAAFRSELRFAVRDAKDPDQVDAPRPLPAAPRQRRTVIRLWLPLTPLWILLSPFALILAPLIWLAPQCRGVPPYRTAFAVGAALFALSGTVVDVDAPDAQVRIHIY